MLISKQMSVFIPCIGKKLFPPCNCLCLPLIRICHSSKIHLLAAIYQYLDSTQQHKLYTCNSLTQNGVHKSNSSYLELRLKLSELPGGEGFFLGLLLRLLLWHLEGCIKQTKASLDGLSHTKTTLIACSTTTLNLNHHTFVNYLM